MNLRCGIADFGELRHEGFYYVDKTAFIAKLEDMSMATAYMIYLRPRRFGKSLLISTLDHYYDINRADQFDDLLGISAITVGDLASSANIFGDITLDSRFHALTAFTTSEVEALADAVLGSQPFALDRDQVLRDVRFLYDGYTFSHRAKERLFNPDMVLHFFRNLVPPDQYPEQLLDQTCAWTTSGSKVCW